MRIFDTHAHYDSRKFDDSTIPGTRRVVRSNSRLLPLLGRMNKRKKEKSQ